MGKCCVHVKPLTRESDPTIPGDRIGKPVKELRNPGEDEGKKQGILPGHRPEERVPELGTPARLLAGASAGRESSGVGYSCKITCRGIPEECVFR